MAIRSTRFALAFGPALANTTYSIYTVPAGFRAVLRHVQIRSLGACTTLIGISGPAGGPFSLLARVDAAAVGGAQLDCWLVFDAGEAMTVRCSVANNINYAYNGVLMEL